MGEFCNQCTKTHLGLDRKGDFAGLTTPADEKAGLAVLVLCEGCGPIQVNHAGDCITPNCEDNGHTDTNTDVAVKG